MYLQTVGDPEFTLIAVGVAVRPTQRDPAHGTHHVTVGGLVHTTWVINVERKSMLPCKIENGWFGWIDMQLKAVSWLYIHVLIIVQSKNLFTWK